MVLREAALHDYFLEPYKPSATHGSRKIGVYLVSTAQFLCRACAVLRHNHQSSAWRSIIGPLTTPLDTR